MLHITVYKIPKKCQYKIQKGYNTHGLRLLLPLKISCINTTIFRKLRGSKTFALFLSLKTIIQIDTVSDMDFMIFRIIVLHNKKMSKLLNHEIL